MPEGHSPSDVCLVEGCGRPISKVGLCQSHYRLKRQGKEMRPIGRYVRGVSPDERLWAYVNKSGPTQPHMDTPCWVWTGSTTRENGYGRLVVWDAATKTETRTVAHRFSWELANGPIPNGLSVLHRCDNPVCVRVEHLFLGDATDNMRDMVQKGRNSAKTRPDRVVRGEDSSSATLTEAIVREMREMYAAGERISTIAAATGVARRTVGKVVHRLTWKHIP